MSKHLHYFDKKPVLQKGVQNKKYINDISETIFKQFFISREMNNFIFIS